MKILDGKAAAKEIEAGLKNLISKAKRPPGLAFVIVGKNPASHAYVRMKKKKSLELGIVSKDIELADSVSEALLLKQIALLNEDPSIDGILVQLPLPSHIHVEKVIASIDPSKDVDGFHPINMGKLLVGEESGFFPCTPYGILKLLQHYHISPSGKHVVIVGRSNIVGKPLAALLMQKKPHLNATVTIAHSGTQHLLDVTWSADILIAAMGCPHFIQSSMVRPGAVVIDVGLSRVQDQLIGDVDFKNVAPLAAAITPVPGGVGPMTIAMLMSNTVLSYSKRMV